VAALFLPSLLLIEYSPKIWHSVEPLSLLHSPFFPLARPPPPTITAYSRRVRAGARCFNPPGVFHPPRMLRCSHVGIYGWYFPPAPAALFSDLCPRRLACIYRPAPIPPGCYTPVNGMFHLLRGPGPPTVTPPFHRKV